MSWPNPCPTSHHAGRTAQRGALLGGPVAHVVQPQPVRPLLPVERRDVAAGAVEVPVALRPRRGRGVDLPELRVELLEPLRAGGPIPPSPPPGRRGGVTPMGKKKHKAEKKSGAFKGPWNRIFRQFFPHQIDKGSGKNMSAPSRRAREDIFLVPGGPWTTPSARGEGGVLPTRWGGVEPPPPPPNKTNVHLTRGDPPTLEPPLEITQVVNEPMLWFWHSHWHKPPPCKQSPSKSNT